MCGRGLACWFLLLLLSCGRAPAPTTLPSFSWDEDRWYQEIDQGDLAKFLQAVQINNEEFQELALQVRASAVMTEGLLSHQLPTLDFDLNTSESDTPDALNEDKYPRSFRRSKSSSAGFTLNLDFDLWGRLEALDNKEFLEHRRLEETVRSMRNRLMSDVIKSYIQYKSLLISEKRFRQMIETQEQLISMQEELIQEGLRPVGRLLEMRQDLRIMQRTETALRRDLKKARGQLQHYARSQDVEAWTKPIDIAQFWSGPFEGRLDRVDDRSDVRTVLYNIEVARQDTHVAMTDLLPKISLTAEGGYQADSVRSILDPDHAFWNLLGNLTAPLLHREAGQASLEAAKIKEEELRLRLQKTVANAFFEISQLMDDANHVQDDLKLLDEQLEWLLQEKEHRRSNLEKGLATKVELLEVEVDIARIEHERAQLHRDRLFTKIDLARATGS